jgi:Flp pilus assembly protein TadG
MVEFALTISLTLLLIFGMIDFSRAVYTASVIQWAAQYGARTAITYSTPAPALVSDSVVGRLAGLDPAKVDVDPIWAGNLVSVTVTYPFEFIVPLLTGSIEMSASASMVAY